GPLAAEMELEERHREPPDDAVRFTLLTPAGLRVAEESLERAESGESPYSPLFAAGSHLMQLLTNTHTVSRATEALIRDPRDATAYFQRAQANAALGNEDEALADYTEAINLEPFNAEPYHARGWLYFTRDEYANSVADFDEVIQRQPENADAWKRRA